MTDGVGVLASNIALYRTRVGTRLEDILALICLSRGDRTLLASEPPCSLCTHIRLKSYSCTEKRTCKEEKRRDSEHRKARRPTIMIPYSSALDLGNLRKLLPRSIWVAYLRPHINLGAASSQYPVPKAHESIRVILWDMLTRLICPKRSIRSLVPVDGSACENAGHKDHAPQPI